MCGIVGYIGAQQAQDILLDGLSRLEYRGYDSAGIAVMDGGKCILQLRGVRPFFSDISRCNPLLLQNALPTGDGRCARRK